MRGAHQYKVIAPDVPDKAFRAGAFAHCRTDQTASNHQDLIAPTVAVAIVKSFEVVDVKICQSKGSADFDAAGGLVEDGRVAGKTGQRIRVQRTGHPTQA